jgi:uncharacterized membrane protein
MEDLFKSWAGTIALAIEAGAVLIIAIGAVEALVRTAWRIVSSAKGVTGRKEIWVRFAIWLLLGLEFELAADVVRSAISPTWTAIGMLGAIAAIRTALNYFLERDISEFAAEQAAAPPAA